MVTTTEQPTAIRATRRRMPPPADSVTFQLMQSKGEEYRATPLHRHFEPDLGAAFYLRVLTGSDMENAMRLAGDKPEDTTKYMVFLSCVQPSIGPLEWTALNSLSPGIKGRLLAAIREISGIGDDALDKAKLLSLGTDGDDSYGTDSPENSEPEA